MASHSEPTDAQSDYSPPFKKRMIKKRELKISPY
jgi:hypothetical protein